ncbi:EF-hand domain-containing protein [Herminiimonas arsenitoxidans]|uniref:EF-hand domain-containing protein n=1 Tax=Herminiimonas arsenitoxidans TaxID=1809410 RepID=UPI0009709ABA|nr:EF-hand domain-containing protein [Herminiimonas arsenitoxidans]
MAIGGVSSSTSWTVQRPDATKIANDLFAKVDTKNQGYIDKAALQSALEQVSADGSSTSTDVDQFLSKIDTDSDGKITKQELTDGVKQLADQLDAQFDSSRVARAGAGEPPPAPPSIDDIFSSLDTKNQGYLDKESLQAAFDKNSTDTEANTAKVEEIFKALDTDGDNKITKEELAAGIDQLGGPNGAASAASGSGATEQAAGAPPAPPAGGGGGGSSAGSSTTKTYEAADTNQDGTVSLQELVAYQLSEASKTASSETDKKTSMDAVMKIMTQLAQTYGKFDQDIANSSSSVNVISETA